MDTAAEKIGSRVPPWKRPKLKPWMTDPELMALYDGILAAKMDRLSRAGWRDEAETRMWAEDNGKRLLIVTPELQWPPRDNNESLLWGILANQAAQEWENTSQRYKRMARFLRENGYLANKAPYWLDVVETGEHKTLTLAPDKAPYIFEAIERYLAGQTNREACEWLDTTPANPIYGDHWQPSTLSGILHNPALIGHLESKGTIVRGSDGQPIVRCPPLISQEMWERLQAKLDAIPLRRSTAPPSTAMLTGILFCGKCNGPMYRFTSKTTRPKTARRPREVTYVNAYYRCGGTMREPSLCRNMVPMAEAEEVVNDAVMAYADHPHREKRIIPGDDTTLRMAEIQNALAELPQELGTMPYDEYQAKRTRLETEFLRLQNTKPRPKKIEWITNGRTVGDVWQALDARAKRTYLLEHGWRFWYHGRSPEGTARMVGESRDLVGDIAGLSGMTTEEYEAAEWDEIAALLRERGIDPDKVRREAQERLSMSPAERFRATRPRT